MEFLLELRSQVSDFWAFETGAKIHGEPAASKRLPILRSAYLFHPAIKGKEFVFESGTFRDAAIKSLRDIAKRVISARFNACQAQDVVAALQQHHQV